MDSENTTFAQRLNRGTDGVRFKPSFMQVVEEYLLGLICEDDTHGLVWHISLAFCGFDTNSKHDIDLRQDFDMFAWEDFTTSTPRTEEESWSPIITMEWIDLQGGLGLCAICRRSYEPRNEVIVGELFVPSTVGVFVFHTESKAEMTGLRESYLTDRALAEHSPSTEQDIEHNIRTSVTQMAIDDPALDELFPSHPLSRIRKALDWFIKDSEIAVYLPGPSSISGGVRLDKVGCSVVLPPRYVYYEHPRINQEIAVATRCAPPGRKRSTSILGDNKMRFVRRKGD